jgi:UDP:flavonoid glycosyltransferase YjiC (YdhE family)
MRALLTTTGSMGDFLPFVGLGKELRARGYEVVLIAGGAYEHFAREAEIRFVPLYSAAEHDRRMAMNWSGLEAIGNWLAHVGELITPVFSAIQEHHVPGETVVVHFDWLFGARIAGEALGCPVATVHMQPSVLRAAKELFPWAPRAVGKGILRVVDWFFDRNMGGAVQQLRGRYGLPPVSRLLQWWNSPDVVIGFFPEWFAARQPEWPANLILPGFALYEPDKSAVLPASLVSFLDAGPPPIVFGQGSYAADTRPYFQESVEAARRVGRRAILLTPRPEQLPDTLPEGIIHSAFVPHRLLLPRAAAFVHHGGTGSLAAGLAAAVPQLLVPAAGDQPDNARRLELLGVSATIPVARYHADRVVEKISPLLSSSQVRERCREYAGRMHGSPFAVVADALESICSRRRTSMVEAEG